MIQQIKEGYVKTKIQNEWKRMHAMDVSDVYYDQFQINGLQQSQNNTYTPGDTVRLRVINDKIFCIKHAQYIFINLPG